MLRMGLLASLASQARAVKRRARKSVRRRVPGVRPGYSSLLRSHFRMGHSTACVAI
jgi:hypothetical protein